MVQFAQEGWDAILAGNAGQISIVGMTSVFFALTALAIFMAALGKLFQARDAGTLPSRLHTLLGGAPLAVTPRLTGPAPTATPEIPDAEPEEEGVPAGVLAAIAAAIALDLEATSRTPARSGPPIPSWRQSARRLTQRPGR